MSASDNGNEEPRNREGGFILICTAVANAIIAYIVERDQRKDQEQGTAYEIARWTKSVATWTRWLVVVGGITCIILLLQLCILRTTDQTFRAVQRAFVTVSDISIEPVKTGDKITAWSVRPIIENSGSTPTKDLQYYSSGVSGPTHTTTVLGPTYPIGQIPSIIDTDQGYYDNIDNPNFPDARLSRLPLGPHAKTSIGHLEFSDEQLRQYNSPIKWKAYLAATIHYWDQFEGSTEHITKYCYAINFIESGNGDIRPTTELCTYWNCTDDECKADRRDYRKAVARVLHQEGKEVPPDFYKPVPDE